ncbi:unnamed protein product [Brassica rapa]|uniref:Uncharacterized protein n=1 Tax=Brassica campestris TaxID=3711 RepID=A0A8D9MBA5_BRACM|nr:unnamed protein product [Brassica rapa]
MGEEEASKGEDTVEEIRRMSGYGGDVIAVGGFPTSDSESDSDLAAAEIMIIWAIQGPTSFAPNTLVSQSSLELRLDACGHSLSILQSPCSLNTPGVTGSVMWDSGVVLGKFLEHSVDSKDLSLEGKKIVELGSGCGLVGCVAALLGGDVVLTDLPDRLRLLKKNIDTNLQRGNTRGSAVVQELVWGDDPDPDLIEPFPDYVLGSDVIYSEEAVHHLIQTLVQLCGDQTTIFLSGELRNAGPLTMKLEEYNGTLPSLVSTTYSWTKTTSIIFLDQPVGTGFSYSRTQLVDKPSDSGEAKRVHEFLHKWLGKHEEFISNPLYVGGDSYSGKVVPALVQEISKGNYQCCKPPINLQGYVLGNPLTEFETDMNSRIPFAHGMALISDELYESLKIICKGKYVNVDPSNTECLKLVEEYNKCTETVNPFLILEPFYEAETPDSYIYRYLLATCWANDESVRKALQINKESIGRWIRCNLDIPYTQDIISSVPYHVDNSIDGYRSLIYSGDHDLGMPYLGTQAWIRSLNYSVIDDWRPWMINSKLAGEVDTLQSLNQRKALSCFKGGSVANLCKQYIGVGEEEEVQLFYYFIKSERNPEEDPLFIWLNGGPGCSSISGLLFENEGPLTMKLEVYNGTLPSLVSTTYSWTKTSSIIYLDQPVGTGFSFSTQHVDTPSDSGEARRIHEFLQKWLAKHEEFIPNPFYVGGHSYTGKIVPPLVQEISKGNYQRHKPTINLQGYLLGNPVTEFEIDWNSRIPFAHEMALISDELYESLKRICKGKYVNVDPGNTECLKLLEEYNKFTKTVNPFLISEPSCETETPDCYIYRHLLATYWANDESVRRALQINKESIGRWVRCNFDIPYTHDIINSVPYHVDNSINGYRSLIFSGDHDLGVPYLGTQDWIRSLNYSVIDDWRPWMIYNKPAGCTTTYANKMTFVTIKASGHTAEFKPEESSVMFQRWISGQPL